VRPAPVTASTDKSERLAGCPPPQAMQPGWYPDPLGSTAERYWDGGWGEEIRATQRRLTGEALSNGAGPGRAGLRLRSLRSSLPLLGRADREQRERERQEELRARIAELARQEFYGTPAGRARVAYERGQSLFQYELEVGRLEPIVIPSEHHQPPLETTDPVDVLNSVVAEGWKLANSEFHYIEMHGMVGCYVFKRSPKRRRPMNDPWQALNGAGGPA
jgi:Protein of unknown function (DUF2510)